MITVNFQVFNICQFQLNWPLLFFLIDDQTQLLNIK